MKHLFTLFLMIIVFSSCRENTENEEIPAVNEEQLEEIAYISYGEKIHDEQAMTSKDLAKVYQNLKINDSVQIKVKTTINGVCAKKGCWIEIPVGDETARVTFKDYGFFLPKNGQGKEVVLVGEAFKSKTSKEDLKHFAMDAGKSQEEIDAITEDEVTLSFQAVGALVESFENPDVFVPAPAKETE